MPRLKDKYKEEVVPALRKEFNYSNINEVPRITKMVVNIGLGERPAHVGLFGPAD
jgi:large subunit ribosomal protein L5